MSRSRSAQVHVVVVRDPEGRTWVVGTPSQKGFTESGALKSLDALLTRIPRDWDKSIHEITPIDEVLPRTPVPAP